MICATTTRRAGPTIERLQVIACQLPTDAPESDGTLAWDQTTMVIVRAHAEGQAGLGYTYANIAAASLIESRLDPVVRQMDAFDTRAVYQAMRQAVRNQGQSGLAAMAISAVDQAVWDLKARVLGVSLVKLLGQVHDAAPIYGSGGFTSYTDAQLRQQLEGWVEQGIERVKIKVGRAPNDDPRRVALARKAVGDSVELMVDGNGGYARKEALQAAHIFASQSNVIWFEEPRPSDDIQGLRLLRDRAPASMEIAAGEYGFTLDHLKALLDHQAVDVLQADVTRCGGVTGFLDAAALCDAHKLPLSAHCAPAVSTHVCCAIAPLRHIEYFHDHVRIERSLFEGLPARQDGKLVPDPGRPGHGLELNESAARQYEI